MTLKIKSPLLDIEITIDFKIYFVGWGDLFVFETARGKKVTVGSATPAILMVLVVFALPTRYRFWPFQALNKAPETSPSLIDWKTVETKLPWGVILLLGGGFAVSDACTKSGLSKWLVAKCMILVGLPAWLINAIVCVLTAALTQVNIFLGVFLIFNHLNRLV